MTALLNKALAGAVSALVLILLAGCKPGPDPRPETDRTEATTRRSSPAGPAGPAGSAADRETGDAAATRTASMGAAPAVPPPAVPGALPPPAGGREPDLQITAGVRAGLAADTELREVRIDVDTRDGVVTLSGSVPTAAIRARAGEIAHAVRGVRRVNDQLTLASG